MLAQKKYFSFAIFLLLLPVFQPKLFTQYLLVKWLYAGLNVLLFFGLLFYYCVQVRTIKKADMKVSWCVYRLYLFFMMCVLGNMAFILQWVNLTLMVINLLLLFDICEKQDKIPQLLYTIGALCLLLLLINYVTLLIYPRGIIRSDWFDAADNDWYFLGIKTQFTNVMLPGVAASAVLYAWHRNKASVVLLIAVLVACALNIIGRDLATPIVGFIIMVVLLVLRRIRGVRYNLGIMVFVSAIVSIVIVGFGVSDLFAFFITEVLHKSMTLSSRTMIWQSALTVLREQGWLRTIFGNGEVYSFVPYGTRVMNSHNEILTLFYCGGIVGSLLFLHFLGNCIYTFRSTNKRAPSFLIVVCFTETIMMITESYFDTAICYIPFLLLPYIYRCTEKKMSCGEQHDQAIVEEIR